jgi:sortase A
MILAGLALLAFTIGFVIRQNVQENSPVVLVNSGIGPNAENINAFRPPLQEQVTPLIPIVTGSELDSSQALQVPSSQIIGKMPDRLEIPSIEMDAPILAEHYKEIYQNDQVFIQWRVPFRRASGWHDTTALLGEVGNTVLNGHHNAYGEVFKDLVDLKEGDIILVHSGESAFEYQVNVVLLLPEKYESMEERIKNASWIMPTTDERVTLVTCWPPESNTHRLIVVAFPVKENPTATQ